MHEYLITTLIARLKARLKELKLPRTRLAEYCGLHRNTLKFVDRDDWSPSMETLDKLELHLLLAGEPAKIRADFQAWKRRQDGKPELPEEKPTRRRRARAKPKRLKSARKTASAKSGSPIKSTHDSVQSAPIHTAESQESATAAG